MGISEEDLAFIFNPYYQSNSKNVSLGAGLGLNLCKEIITLYNGEIFAQSQKEKGTEISFYILVKEDKYEQNSYFDKLKALAQKEIISVAILDDDTMTLSILKKLLESSHIKVQEFSTLHSLKEFLKTNEVSFFISDLNLPDGNSITFFQENDEFNNHKKPILLITGDTYATQWQELINMVDEIITKPINKNELFEKIFRILEGQKIR